MTTEEMSIQFANKIYGKDITDEWLKARYFYERGAKAVLEEIEKYMDMQDGCYALECIQMRINELRGGEK